MLAQRSTRYTRHLEINTMTLDNNTMDPPDEEIISETLGYYDAAYADARDALGEALAKDAPHLLPLFDAMARSVVEVLHAYAHVAVSGEVHHDKVWDYLASTENTLAEVLEDWNKVTR